MDSESEIQALIALIELEQPIETPNNCHYAFHPRSLEDARRYFHLSPLDLAPAFDRLVADGLACRDNGGYRLTASGEAEAARLRRDRPPIFYWYSDFYRATHNSPANSEYCRRVFGADLCQDGFMDMDGLHQLIEVTGLHSGEDALDLGCGNGQIAEFISDRTGAHLFGMDYIPEAIRQAQQRTAAKRDRLAFRVGNMDEIPYPPASFDVILSVDTLYMPNDLTATLRQLKAALRSGGRMGIFYSFALWEDLTAGKENLLPGNTPLGVALNEAGFSFQTWDFTDADYQHAQRKLEVIEELRPAFEREGSAFLVENRLATAKGVIGAVEAGTHKRYLYLARSIS
jgi:SAM-dependent methyltransferase